MGHQCSGFHESIKGTDRGPSLGIAYQQVDLGLQFCIALMKQLVYYTLSYCLQKCLFKVRAPECGAYF